MHLLRFTLLLSLLGCCSLRAEPMHPVLSRAGADSTRVQLGRSSLTSKQIPLLLRLAEYHLYHYQLLDTSNYASTVWYCRKAYRLSVAESDDTGLVRSQYLLSSAIFQHGDSSQARQLVQSALLRSQTLNDKALEAEGWYYTAEQYAETPAGLAQKIACYEQARVLYQQSGNPVLAIHQLKCIADLHYVQGRHLLALHELQAVLAAYQAIHYPRLHYTYDLLAALSRSMGNYQNALHYGLVAIDIARRTRDTTDLGLFYLRMGVVNGELKQDKECLHYLQLAFQHFQSSHNNFMTLATAGKIVRKLIEQNKPREALAFCHRIDKQYSKGDESSRARLYDALGRCYMALQDYPMAERYYLRAMATNKRIDTSTRPDLPLYLAMVDLYLVTKQYDKAQLYIEKARASIHNQSVQLQASLELRQIQLAEIQGQYRKALTHQKRYGDLNDSIFNETRSKQIANLQIQYDTKAKEQNIALLTKQNHLQRASIRQKELQRNSFIISASLLLLLTGMVYNRYRLKQRSNQLLEVKQTEINDKNEALEQALVEKEWMMKEIHHRVKNNLQVVSSLLYSQAVYLRDPAARIAIRESQNRVQTMGLLHQHLYQGSGHLEVAMAAYLGGLARHLLQSFSRQESICLELDVADVALDMTLAVPVGLLLNEALTNALKYAYAPGESGLIALHLRVEHQECLLRLRDEGVGLPPDFDPANSPTLGWNMIHGLSQQLGATLQITTTRGVQLDLRFASVVHAKPPGLAA